jgi:PASTA domain
LTSSTPWLGAKRVAFVPLFRSNATPPDLIPPDWANVILGRVVYDPRPEANGADRSLRAWLRTVSSGRADIDPLVIPMQTIDRQVVEADDLEGSLGASLRAQGVESAILIMLGGRGAGTNRGFWSRAVMAESNGVWLMEIIHSLTGFADLYHFNNDVDPIERSIDTFDEMSASSQTHPTAFTKNELGWLDATAIRVHDPNVFSSADYRLQYVSLTQPPLAGQAAAVRIGTGFPYVMVEARKKTDQFETGLPSTFDAQERGIASEGVIAYRVQTRNPTVQAREDNKKPLYLMTLTALQAGQSTMLDNDTILTVTSTNTAGLNVRLRQAPSGNDPVTVPDVIGADSRDARFVIQLAGLGAQFTGPLTNSEVQEQSPEGGDIVQKGSKVKLKMIKSQPL